MQTRSGIKVSKLKLVGNSYVGLVNGDIMTWNKDGRRSDKNKSKLDLVFQKKTASNVFYVNVTKHNGEIKLSRKKYSSLSDAKKDTRKGYIKTIEVAV